MVSRHGGETTGKGLSTMRRVFRAAAYASATFFGCGYCPVAPGTAGSLGALLLYLPLRPFFAANPLLFGAAIAGLTAAGVLAAGVTARAERKEDPSLVVIDEAAGQWLALLLLPVISWQTLLLSFLVFRAFDIWKPFPAAQAEHLPGGVGIMADDLVAGAYANLILQGLCRIPGALPWLS